MKPRGLKKKALGKVVDRASSDRKSARPSPAEAPARRPRPINEGPRPINEGRGL